MSDLSDRFKRRQAQSLALMDSNDRLIGGVQRMPEAWDYGATPITDEHYACTHDAIRAARHALSTGLIADYDLIEFLAARLPRGRWRVAIRYMSSFMEIGDERH